jgi:hypothetical protein
MELHACYNVLRKINGKLWKPVQCENCFEIWSIVLVKVNRTQPFNRIYDRLGFVVISEKWLCMFG